MEFNLEMLKEYSAFSMIPLMLVLIILYVILRSEKFHEKLVLTGSVGLVVFLWVVILVSINGVIIHKDSIWLLVVMAIPIFGTVLVEIGLLIGLCSDFKASRPRKYPKLPKQDK